VACCAILGGLPGPELRFVLFVAGDAPFHIHFDGLIYSLHASDVAVAGRAGNVRSHMSRMRKVDIFWLFVDPNPGDRRAG